MQRDKLGLSSELKLLAYFLVQTDQGFNVLLQITKTSCLHLC